MPRSSAAATPPASAPTEAGDRLLTVLEARRLGPIRRWFATHPRGTDIVVAAWYFIPSLFSLLFPVRYPGVHWPLVALTTAALMLRRRHPVAVLAFTVGASALSSLVIDASGGHEFAVMLAIYAVASLRRPRTAWLCTAAAIAVQALMFWLSLDTYVEVAMTDGVDPLPRASVYFGVMLWVALISLAAHAVGSTVRSRREHQQYLVDLANRSALERDQRAQLAAADERARIAREMHDVIAHSVTVMVALADGATASLDKAPDRSRVALQELSSTGREALTQMRSILGVLRTEHPETDSAPFDGDVPLAPTVGDIGDLLERFRAVGLTVERVDSGPPLPNDPRLSLTMYRIIQESLTNVLRYAKGSQSVRIEITHGGGAVDIVVTNTAGTGTTHPGSGNGLVGLRERVASHGGSVTAGPFGAGWRVHATLPIATSTESS